MQAEMPSHRWPVVTEILLSSGPKVTGGKPRLKGD